MKLDLGCGPTPRDGYIGVDLHCGPEKVDLRSFPWPWADSSVNEIVCSHYVEHQTPAEWVRFVDELYRVLKPGGTAEIIHPHPQSVRAFQDPTHLDFIPLARWLYTIREWRQGNGLDHPPYPTCDFRIVEGGYMGMSPTFEIRGEEAKVFAQSHYWDAVGDVRVLLEAVKE